MPTPIRRGPHHHGGNFIAPGRLGQSSLFNDVKISSRGPQGQGQAGEALYRAQSQWIIGCEMLNVHNITKDRMTDKITGIIVITGVTCFTVYTFLECIAALWWFL